MTNVFLLLYAILLPSISSSQYKVGKTYAYIRSMFAGDKSAPGIRQRIMFSGRAVVDNRQTAGVDV